MATLKYNIPEIIVGQAQKEVTHNEGLYYIDALLKNPIIADNVTTPPATPNEGDFYIVPVGATGSWAGQDNKIAGYINNVWVFFTPFNGMSFFSIQYNDYIYYDGTNWVQYLSTIGLNNYQSKIQNIIINQESTANGGASVVGYNKKLLNIVHRDDTTAVVLNPTGDFSLPLGTYNVNIVSTVYNGGNNYARFLNLTTGGVLTTLAVGTTNITATNTVGISIINTTITVTNTTDVYYIEHYCSVADPNGLGFGIAQPGENNVYTAVNLQKIA